MVLSSCDKPIVTISPGNSEVIESESPSIEPSQTVQPSPSIEPTPTYTFTQPPNPPPTETPIPERPEASTPEQYFTFDAMHGVLLDYDIEGGRYVSIPSSIDGVEVVKIGEDAFRGKDLYGVIVPDTVKIIEKSAFEWCRLRELTLGKNVETINDNAFYNCGITNLVLPSNVKYIGNAAFSNNGLSSIIIPDSVTYIGDSAFSSYFLSSIVIPDNVTYIGPNAFGRLAEDKITLGKGVTSFWVIEGNTLLGHIGKPAPNLIIPSFAGVNTIGEFAFSSCNLLSVTIPDNISIIERGAFGGNKGLNITIPSSVVSINEYCFSEDTVINYEAGSYAEYYAKGRYTHVVNGSSDSAYFPIERNDIINANISFTSKQDFKYPLIYWTSKYLSNKYYNNEITYIGISTTIYEDSKYYIYDKTDSSMLDGYTVKTKQYYVILSANKDITGMTRSTSGYYGFYIQVIVFYNEDGTVILSGFLQGEENMLDTRTDLYNYVVGDNRFTFNEYTEAGSILNSTTKTKIFDSADPNRPNKLIAAEGSPDPNIPGTDFKLVQKYGTVSLYNTTTGVNNILLKEKLQAGAFWGKYYFFRKILDNNRFIYVCSVSNGYVPSDCYTYIYDIRDGSSIELYGSDINIVYAGHYGDKYFATYAGYNLDAWKIYTITTEGIEEGKLTCITENVDMCMAIKDFSFTADGRYLLMLTSVYASKEEDPYYGSEHIVVLDTETKKVLYQDELIMENGKITHFQDDTFCVDDGKTLIYIDISK